MKRLRYENGSIDAIDVLILRALFEDARVTMTDLARKVGLSAPSVTERVRRLEEGGVVQGYGVEIDPVALGLSLEAYIRIRPMPGQLRKVADVLAGLEAVTGCDRVTGEDCFIARAHVRSVKELEAVIDEIMPYAMTNTSIVQSSPVKRRLPPLGGPAAY